MVAQIAAAGLQDFFDLRLKHHTNDEVATLMGEADGFVFPYREIEASGVLYLVNDLARWMIASDIGAFSEMIVPGVNGALVSPGDSTAALSHSIEARPQ